MMDSIYLIFPVLYQNVGKIKIEQLHVGRQVTSLFYKVASSCYVTSQRIQERLEAFLKYKNVVFNSEHET